MALIISRIYSYIINNYYGDAFGTKVSGRGWLLIRGGHFFSTVVCDEPTNNDLIVTNYTAPALEGSIIAIECDEMQCTECHHTSTCVEGRWEPSLSQIAATCKGMHMLYNIMWVIARYKAGMH